MKKLFSSFCLLAFVISSYSQVKTVNISHIKIGRLFPCFDKTINLETGDTTYTVSLVYARNKGFETTHLALICLSNQTELDTFIADLRSSYKEMESKINLSWVRNKYAIKIYETNKYLFIYEPPDKGTAQVIFNKKEVEKLLEWIETINIVSA